MNRMASFMSNPKHPVYIISKGRWEKRLTSKLFDKSGIPYQLVIEPQEYDHYAAVIDPAKILVLPFSNLGQGSIPARNWVWQHAIDQAAKRHWIFDDNVVDLFRLHDNHYYRDYSGTTLNAMEEFVDRYENIALAGPQFLMFGTRKCKHKPFVVNTRIYSMILINNDIPYRWRGKYNEDTDLSLRALKDGWCTVLFCAFIGQKLHTMTNKGGNTESLYKLDGVDGRLLMAQSLQQQHPDVTQIKRRWGRWQHVVNYKPFKRNRLIKKEGVKIPQGVNNYGMVLIKK